MKQKRRILEGVVVSDKMDKTIVVRVERLKVHPLYKKAMRRHKKFKAHDENNTAKKGDKVKIIEARPYSKEKRFALLELIKEKAD